jgi:O-antigen/teichoic acid export membrane protein
VRAIILRGVGANAFGQVITVLIQLLSLPLCLHVWSLSKYGTWVLISAVPGYLIMGDLGMVSAAGTRMTLALSRGDAEAANVSFHTACAFMLGALSAASMGLLVIAWWGAPWLSAKDESAAFIFLCFGVLLALFSSLMDITLRATDRYASSMSFINLARLSEWIGLIIGLFYGGRFESAALGSLLGRAVATAAVFIWSNRLQRSFTWSLKSASREELKIIAALSFPISYGLLLQGVTLIVGHALGSAEVAIFTIYRTVARITIQISGIYGNALWTSFARAFGAGNDKDLRLLYTQSVRISLILTAVVGVGLYSFFPMFLQRWTHNDVPYRPALCLLMVIYASIGSVSLVPRIVLIATNHHVTLSLIILTTAICTVSACFLFQTRETSELVTVILIASEIVMCLATYYLVAKQFFRDARF